MQFLKQKSMRSLLAGLTAAAMLFSATAILPPEQAMAAESCVIDTSKEYQNIRGFGGINHPEWTGQDLTPAQRQTAFGNGDGELGFTVLRIFVNPDKNQWYRALPTAQAATEMGVTIFASPWEPPANLAESGGSNGKLHLPKSNYGAYAQHLNDFGTYMKDNGVDLYSISVQNEPDYAHDWTYWSTDETTDFLANYADKITSTRVMSPESFQYAPENASWVADGGKKFYTKILNNQKAMENCDLFGTHFYGTQRGWMDFPALESSGKEIWMTEVYVPNSEPNSNERWPEALDVAENIHNGLVVGNMSAYVWWYIRRNYGPMNEDGSISKRGYMMAQYSKYVRPGDVRIAATESPADNVLISAYKGSDNQVTIVAINKGTEGYSQNFTFQNGTITDIDRYRSSGNENLALTANLENDGTSFWAQLPAQSVTTFVVTMQDGSMELPNPPSDTPSVPSAPEANEYGWYFHDEFEGDTCTWQSRGAASIMTSGRTAYIGNEALLVQERESAWNGAYRTLNPLAFVPGEEFSFSANVMYFDGDETDTFYMKLQYTGADGEPHYSTIAEATGVKGEWVQLANKNYKIPEGATDMMLYIETAETTNNFYIDEAIGAIAGTTINGAGQPEIPQPTEPPTTEPPVSVKYTLGDVNNDGVINGFDVAIAKRGNAKGFADEAAALAADVNQNGKADDDDIKQLTDYVMGKIKAFYSTSTSSIPDYGTAPNTSAAMYDNFRTGSSEYFFASDGWTNGNPFDCVWTKNNTKFVDGALTLTIDKDTSGKYNYTGAEYRTSDHYHYGYYETSMQAIKNDGVVSSFFTYTGPSEDNPWDEIDIEILGKDTTKVQLNYYTDGVGNHEFMYDLGFDASEGYHTYGFDWQPDHITWYVDGKAVYTAYDNIPSTPGRIMMNTWPGTGVNEWLKPFDGKTPLTARYQWVTYNKTK